MGSMYGRRSSCHETSTGSWTPVAILSVLLSLVVGCDRGTDRREERAASQETAGSKPSRPASQPGRRDVWLLRAVKGLQSIKDREARTTAAVYTSIRLAEMSNYQQARQLVRKFVTDDDRRMTFWCVMAGIQSLNGDLEEATATADGLPNAPAREIALSFVAVRQAQRGEIGHAVALMHRIREPEQLDGLRKWVAIAQVKAGDLDAAKATASKIGIDQARRDAMKAIAEGEARKMPALDAIDSPFIRGHLQALLVFSKFGAWCDGAANAIVVAKRKNAGELDGWIRKTLTAVEKADQPAPATARLFLCVALAIADRPDEARTMARRFLVAADGKIVRISGLFGEPVTAYLFTRLGMEEELQKVLVTEPGDFRNDGVMQAVGAAEAEAGNWQALETRYSNLSSGTDRVNFSCGVLAGL